MTTPTPTTSAPTRTRMVWMDALRGIAILLIVLLHASVIAQMAGLPVSRAIMSGNAFLEPFRIPLLMVLSGMLLGGSLRKGPGRYIVGKVRAILWPFAVWTLIVVLVFPYHGIDTILLALWAPNTYLWYLHTLFLCYLVALALRRVPPIAALLLSLLAGMLVTLLPLSEEIALMKPERTFTMLVCFFAGHWMMQNLDSVLAVTRRWWVTLLLALVGVGLGLLAISGTQVSNNPWLVLPLLGAIGAAVGLAQRFTWSSWPLAWLRWVGRHSIIYYVTHWIVLDYALMALRHLPDWRGFVLVPALVATAMLVGGLLALAERSIPPVRWLFRI